nr:selenium-binding protein SBP56-related protein [Rhizobium sp. BK176]
MSNRCPRFVERAAALSARVAWPSSSVCFGCSHYVPFCYRVNIADLGISARSISSVFELRPAHDPTKAYGFVNSVLSLEDLSSSIWVLRRDGAKMGGHQNDRYPGGTRRSWRAVSAL